MVRPQVRLTTWALSNALTQYHVRGADDLALGDDLAYLYGLNGTVVGMSFDGARSIVTSSQFGVQAQGHLIGDPSLDPLKLNGLGGTQQALPMVARPSPVSGHDLRQFQGLNEGLSKLGV